MKTIPLWVVASLGEMVSINPGAHQVKLQGIDAGNDGIPYAIVQLNPDDPGDLENVPFDQLAAVRHVAFSLDFEKGTLATS